MLILSIRVKVSIRLAKTRNYLMINFVNIKCVLNFIIFYSKYSIVMQSSNAFKFFDTYITIILKTKMHLFKQHFSEHICLKKCMFI